MAVVSALISQTRLTLLIIRPICRFLYGSRHRTISALEMWYWSERRMTKYTPTIPGGKLESKLPTTFGRDCNMQGEGFGKAAVRKGLMMEHGNHRLPNDF